MLENNNRELIGVSEVLRILMVEDSEDDTELTLRQIRKGGYEPSLLRVDTAEQMRAALEGESWDLVLSDYHLPTFSGAAALQLLHDSGRDYPFIVVSGAIGEETAVSLMREGAHDYIMKDNLARLVPAIERELREVEVRRAHNKAEADLRLAAKVFEGSVEGIMITDADACILRVNRAFQEITGYSEQEVVGKTPRVLQSGRHDETFYRDLWSSMKQGGYWQGEIWNRRKNGEVFPEWLTISSVRDSDGKVSHYIGGFTDLSHQKRAEEHIEHLMYYDPLTDLPNRALFRDRFRHAMLQARRGGDQQAFLLLDLNQFIKVNETLGHHIGDQLLNRVGQRLARSVRAQDVVARLGGDEFAIALRVQHGTSDLLAQLKVILDAFASPFRIADEELFLTPKIGLSLYPDDAGDYDELLRYAEAALRHAKQIGATFQFFERSLSSDAHERLNMENALRRALEREEFELHYQPQMDAASGRIIGLEALLRWRRGGEEMVMPGQFIPLLEETGLIIPVGEWVLQQACRDQRRWLDAGYAPLHIAVNLSPRQFRNRNLVEMIHAALSDNDIVPGLLELEITESSIMDDPEFALRTLQACHERGIRIAIDDFGTGYSSLSYLKRFPLDVLKIDQSFVADIPGDSEDEAIIDAIIVLGHRLNLRIIAEGVETAEQLGFLREQGCDWLQGYYFARPMPYEELLPRLSRCGD